MPSSPPTRTATPRPARSTPPPRPPARAASTASSRSRSPSRGRSRTTSSPADPPPDRTWDLRAARLVNAPTLAVTGRHWDDDTTDFRHAPDEYTAVHFHSDDLDDAGWEPSCALEIPAGLPSGVYAFELRAGDLTDHVPFVVRPPTGRRTAEIALLLPTLTYQVYGNERLVAAGADGMAPAPAHEVHLDPADRWLAAHPEAGASCYDVHPDGDGVSLVSQLRPIPNLRPSFVWWLNDSPERFAADLYLVDWLEEQGEPFDVITDHDLHAEGLGLIEDYDVVLTGTHPEYCTRAMLDALERYVGEEEGDLMYLGGNGFYWVTTIDPERPHLAEVRRGINGTRAWSSRPGELATSTPASRAASGATAAATRTAWSESASPPSATRPTARRATGGRPPATTPEHAWIFEGVEADLFGDYGLFVGGAAGYEIDRHDPAHGSPAEAVVLATSAGLHPPSYLLVVEDLEVTAPEVTGPTTDRVRADLTYVPPASERAARSSPSARSRGAAACRTTATPTTSAASRRTCCAGSPTAADPSASGRRLDPRAIFASDALSFAPSVISSPSASRGGRARTSGTARAGRSARSTCPG